MNCERANSHRPHRAHWYTDKEGMPRYCLGGGLGVEVKPHAADVVFWFNAYEDARTAHRAMVLAEDVISVNYSAGQESLMFEDGSVAEFRVNSLRKENACPHCGKGPK